MSKKTMASLALIAAAYGVMSIIAYTRSAMIDSYLAMEVGLGLVFASLVFVGGLALDETQD